MCSLSDVLETGEVQERYSLSPKACRGILRRADRRGKELPPQLRQVLLTARTGNDRVETEAYITYSGKVAPTITASGTPYARVGFGGNTETEAYVTYRKVSHGEYTEDQGASTMLARDYKDATDLVVIDRAAFNQGVNAKYDPLIKEQETMPTLVARGPHAIQQRDMKVRRLTPRECERLQGFPDDWTRIQWKGKKPQECPDGHRYKAIGNSMAVPVMRWIGQQIKQVNEGN